MFFMFTPRNSVVCILWQEASKEDGLYHSDYSWLLNWQYSEMSKVLHKVVSVQRHLHRVVSAIVFTAHKVPIVESVYLPFSFDQ